MYMLKEPCGGVSNKFFHRMRKGGPGTPVPSPTPLWSIHADQHIAKAHTTHHTPLLVCVRVPVITV